jgi:hypothetical protein
MDISKGLTVVEGGTVTEQHAKLNVKQTQSLSVLVSRASAIREDTVNALVELGEELNARRVKLGINKPRFLAFYAERGVGDIVSKALAAHTFYAWCKASNLDLNTVGKVSGEIIRKIVKENKDTPAKATLETIIAPFAMSDIKERGKAVDTMLRTLGYEEYANDRKDARDAARQKNALGTALYNCLRCDSNGMDDALIALNNLCVEFDAERLAKIAVVLKYASEAESEESNGQSEKQAA